MSTTTIVHVTNKTVPPKNTVLSSPSQKQIIAKEKTSPEQMQQLLMKPPKKISKELFKTKNRKQSRYKDRDLKYILTEPQIATIGARTYDSNSPNSLVSDCYVSESRPEMLASLIGSKVPLSLDLEQSAIDAISKLTDSFSSINVTHTISDSTKNTIDDAVKSIGESKKVIELEVPGLSSVNDMFKLFDKNTPKILIVTVILIIVIWFMPKDVASRAMLFVTIGSLVTIYLESPLIMDAISKYFTDEDNFVDAPEDESSPEIGGISDPLAMLISAVLNGFLAVELGTKIFSVKSVYRLLTDLGKVSQNVKSLMEGATMIMNFVSKSVNEWYNGKDSNAFVLTGHVFIDEFLKEVALIKSAFDNKELHNIQSSVDRVNNCIELGNSVFVKLPGSPEFISVRILIANSLTELKIIKKSLLASNFKFSGVRREPVSILMRGPPGVGKSIAMQHVAHALAARTFEQVEFVQYKMHPSLFAFNRQAEGVYWDGFDQTKKMVFFDDFGQARDVKGNPDNEILNTIRAINTFEDQLHIAALEGKGNTMLRSDFIIANTNLRHFDLIESISDIVAFLRRWAIVVGVCPKPEYCVDPNATFWDRMIDYDKLPAHADGGTSLHPDLLDFHLEKLDLKHKNFVPAGRVLNFEELIDELEIVYWRKTEHYSSYLKDLDATLLKFRRDDKYFDTLTPSEKQLYIRALRSGNAPLLKKLAESEKSESKPESGDEINMDDLDSETSSNIVPMHPDPVPRILTKELSYDTVQDNIATGGIGWKISHEIDVIDYGEIADFLMRHLVVFNYIEDIRLKDIPPTPKQLFKENTGIVVTYAVKNTHIQVTRLMCQIYYLLERDAGHHVDVDTLVQVFKDQLVHEVIAQYKTKDSLLALVDTIVQLYADKLIERPRIVSPFLKTIENAAVRLSLWVKKNCSTVPVWMMRIWETFVFCENFICSVTLAFENSMREDLMKARYFRFFLKTQISVYLATKVFIIFVRIFDWFLGKKPVKTGKKGGPSVQPVKKENTVRKEGESSPEMPDELSSRSNLDLATPPPSSSNDECLQASEVTDSASAPSTNGPESDERHNRAHHKNQNKTVLRRINRRPVNVETSPHSLESTSPNMVDIANSIMNRNQYEFWRPLAIQLRVPKVTHVQCGFVSAIGGHKLLIPYHFMSLIAQEWSYGRLKDPPPDEKDLPKAYADNEVVRLTKSGAKDVGYLIPVKDLVKNFIPSDFADKGDYIVIKVPQITPHRDIKHLFATEAQIENYTKFHGMIKVPFSAAIKSPESHNIIGFRNKNIMTLHSEAFYHYFVERSWVYYNISLAPGDCGVLLLVDDPTRGSVVIGMHVGGHFDTHSNRKVGISTIVTREVVEKLCEGIVDEYKVEDQLDLPITETNPNVGYDNMICLGELPKNLASSSSGKTRKMRSPLWGKWGPAKMAPAKLRPFYKDGELLDPFEKARAEYCVPPVVISDMELFQAKLSLQDHLYYKSSPPKEMPRVLSFEEAVLGTNPNSFKSIPRTTSAGFPYTTYPGSKNKDRFFGTEMDYDLTSEECIKLKADCYAIEAKAKQNIRLTHIFVDCMKDELRKIAKSDNGETRMFCACPTPLLILLRQYFGAFTKWLYENAGMTCCTTGVSEHTRAWDIIAKDLLQFGDNNNIGAGDYKGFDKRHQPVIMMTILEIINEWYDDDELSQNVRKTLWLECINSVHLFKDKIFMWFSAMPSGIFITLMVNDLMNGMLFRLCWMRMALEIWMFNNHVCLKVRGDDNVFSVSDDYKDTFKEKNISIVMLELGQIYTAEVKGEEHAEELRKITDVTFLKRRFVYDENLRGFVAPLELDVVLEIPYWVKKGANSLADVEVNINNCLEELSIHTRETFNYWLPKILVAIDSVEGLNRPSNTSYDYYRNLVLSREHFNAYADSESWTPATLPEIWDGKGVELLDSERTWCIDTYYQETSVAAPLNSRNPRPLMEMALSIGKTRAASMSSSSNNPTTVTDNASPGLQADGTMVSERTMDASQSFADSSTTRATNDAETTVTQMTALKPLSGAILSGPMSGANQEVRDFLKKPQIIATGALSTTDTIPVSLWNLQIPAGLLTAQTIWSNKLGGNLAFRASIVFTIQINANRFQQGRYILAWVPDGGGNDDNVNWDIWIQGHSANLCQFTQLPHVEFDVACDTQATIKIPIVNCVGYYPTQASSGGSRLYGAGFMYLRPYSPLISPTGSTQCNYSIYAHFEDVQFYLPTVPNADDRVIKKIKRRPQRPEEAEADAEDVGVVTAFFSKVSLSAGMLSAIPLLSSVAGTASWAADIAGRVASVWGWSKPHDSAATTKVARYIMPKFNNSDTPDTGTKLAVRDDATIEDLPGFAGSNLDELSISYISTISAWYDTVNWNESATEGTVLFTQQIVPTLLYVNSTYGTNTVTFPTPVAWVSHFFSLWRGSLIFTFKIVKTEFHSGRLLVAFYPFEYDSTGAAPSAPTLAQTAYLHREIIDVRLSNEFKLTIPWMSLSQYKSTMGGNSVTGALYLFVLNPLVAPSSVNNSVNILIEAAGGPDIEFAFPRDVEYTPVLVSTPQSGEKNVCEIVSTGIGNSSLSESLVPARMCIGERVLSLRSFLKRFNPCKLLAAGTITSTFQFLPFSLGTGYLSPGNTLYTAETNDIFTNISLCYALSRGSMRYKIVETTSPATGVAGTVGGRAMWARNLPWGGGDALVGLTNFSYISTLPSVDVSVTGNANNNTLQISNISGGLELVFPYYHHTFAHATCDAMNSLLPTTGHMIYDTTMGTAPRSLALLSFTNAPANAIIYRCGGDDFSLGMFVSTLGVVGWQNSLIS